MKYICSIFLILLVILASCEDDSIEKPGEKPSTFSIRIDNVRHSTYLNEYPQGPSFYTPYLVMSNLPENERILELGEYYSPENPDPDESDYAVILDYSDDELFREWDWTQELIYSTVSLDQLIPNKTYYLKGVVRTDKGTYYSNVVKINTENLPDYKPDPQARELPVVFHVMPYEDGTYPHTYFFDEMLACANRIYQNAWSLPELADAGIKFVPATHTPDGAPLSTPGIHYLNKREILDYSKFGKEDLRFLDNNIWNMTEVINVWICPFTNNFDEDEGSYIEGFSFFPFFNSEEVLQGCNTINADVFSGIFINQTECIGNGYGISGVSIFAHEAGHYLGLLHVFKEDWCDDTPRYDRKKYLAEQLYPYIDVTLRYPIDTSIKPYTALNIMDYGYVIYAGITPQQVERIRYTLQHAYLIPGGKPLPATVKSGSNPNAATKFSPRIIH